MRRIVPMFACAVLVIGFVTPALAEVQAVKGEVIDVQCNMKQGADGAGEDHASCAMRCAKRGATLGILTDAGVYTIAGEYTANNNEKLLDYVAKKVEAKGEVVEKDGKKTMTVASIELQK
ncbi:MAG: hypothetical protein HYX76_10715 [Acidobacteria bacterium]|nr:hypothetical protein [Acidobacteriota bacterium]